MTPTNPQDESDKALDNAEETTGSATTGSPAVPVENAEALASPYQLTASSEPEVPEVPEDKAESVPADSAAPEGESAALPAEVTKTEASKAEASKPETSKAEASKAEASKAEASKTETSKTEATKSARSRERAKSERTKSERTTSDRKKPDRPKSGRPKGERTGLRRTGRILSGLVVLALAGGVAVGGDLLDRAPLAGADPLAVAVPPTEVALACPASTTAPGGSTTSTDTELAGASQSSSAVRALVVARDGGPAAATLGPALTGGTDPVLELTGTESHLVAAAADPTAPMVLRAAPTEAAAAFAVAAAVSRADNGDLRGLTALTCPPSATTSWLLGGNTLVGSSALLTLRNIGSTPATVTVRAWDAIGEVPVSGTATVVPAGQEVTQALEASVPDAERLAIQVTATGGQVSPTIQTSQLTGLTPAGTSVIAPTAMPALIQLLPGVVLTSTTVDESDPSLVRILNPGEEATTVTLDLLGENGVTRLTDEAGLVIEAGAVADVSLAGAPAGTFTVRVSAQDPVVAGAMMVRRGSPAPEDPDVPVMDRTWLPAVTPAVTSALTVPAMGWLVERAVLVIGNDEAENARVTVTAVDATGAVVATQEVLVPATGSASLEMTRLGVGSVAVVLESATPVSAAAVATWNDPLGEMIAVLAAQADPQVERSAAVTISGS